MTLRSKERVTYEAYYLPCLIQAAFQGQSNLDLHDHDFHEIVFITGGSALHVVDGHPYEATAGDVFVLAGPIKHGFDHANGLSIVNIELRPDIIQTAPTLLRSMPGFQALFMLTLLQIRTYGYRSLLHLDPDQLARIGQTLEKMLAESQSVESETGLILESYLRILLVDLARYYQSNNKNSSEFVGRLARAIAHIEQNYMTIESIRELAAMVKVSERHFSRLFRELCQSSPWEYIIGRRLNYACQLLCCSDISISEIAQITGFGDSNYFCRSFRGYYGMSPRMYRNAYVSRGRPGD